MTASFESIFNGTEVGGGREIDWGDNWTNFDQVLNGDDHCGEERQEEGEGKEGGDIDMGLMDFEFVDAIGSSCYYSPFEIAEEMAEPSKEKNYGDEPSTLRERMKYEREVSAFLFAFNGRPECLKLKLIRSRDEKKERSSEHLSKLRNNCNKIQQENTEKEKEENDQVLVQKEVGNQQTSTETVSFSSSSSSPPPSTEEGDELSLWSSLPYALLCSE